MEADKILRDCVREEYTEKVHLRLGYGAISPILIHRLNDLVTVATYTIYHGGSQLEQVIHSHAVCEELSTVVRDLNATSPGNYIEVEATKVKTDGVLPIFSLDKLLRQLSDLSIIDLISTLSGLIGSNTRILRTIDPLDDRTIVLSGISFGSVTSDIRSSFEKDHYEKVRLLRNLDGFPSDLCFAGDIKPLTTHSDFYRFYDRIRYARGVLSIASICDRCELNKDKNTMGILIEAKRTISAQIKLHEVPSFAEHFIELDEWIVSDSVHLFERRSICKDLLGFNIADGRLVNSILSAVESAYALFVSEYSAEFLDQRTRLWSAVSSAATTIQSNTLEFARTVQRTVAGFVVLLLSVVLSKIISAPAAGSFTQTLIIAMSICVLGGFSAGFFFKFISKTQLRQIDLMIASLNRQAVRVLANDEASLFFAEDEILSQSRNEFNHLRDRTICYWWIFVFAISIVISIVYMVVLTS